MHGIEGSMPNDAKVKHIRKADIDLQRQLREEARKMEGQAHRTNNLFVEVLLDAMDQIDQLKAEVAQLKQAV